MTARRFSSSTTPSRVGDLLSARAKKIFGELAYYIALVRALISEGGTVSFRVSSVIITNASRYAGEKVVAPDARITDDTLHVLLAMGHGRWNLIRYGIAFVRGKMATLPDINIVPFRRMTIRSPSGKLVQLDGDNLASVPVEIIVAPEKLQVVVPA